MMKKNTIKKLIPLLFISLTLAAAVLVRWGLVKAFANGTPGIVTVGNLNYILYDGNKTAVVVGSVNPDAVVNLVIPNDISPDGNTYTVTTIADEAFADNKFIRSVEFPASLQFLGSGAFKGCSGLKHVFFDDGSNLKSLGSGAFEGCFSLEVINLPDSIRNLGPSAFENCRALLSINIPTNLAVIEESAFAGCESLPSVQISPSVTHIKNNAFFRCSNLGVVEMHPDSQLQKIGIGAFANCSSLTTFIVPATVQAIEAQAFKNCSQLGMVTFLGKEITLGQNVFDWSTHGYILNTSLFIPSASLSTIFYAGSHEQWDAIVRNSGENLTLSPDNPMLTVVCFTTTCENTTSDIADSPANP